MTSRITNTMMAALAAALIASTALPDPASAGGSVSFSHTPSSDRSVRALRAGLQFYSLYKGLKNGANIRQRGWNNAAGIAQYGSGNQGIIRQKGSGHSATLRQTGKENAYGIFQFGKNTSANVSQYGNGQAGTTFQFGW
ncbi:hypothetical protein SJ05684_b56060 (plasmid) [Sinorhizobium sojae CCBAU 05684]|uniref:Curlin n=1 Tax=Sinorhizobium sojae CCBAU 05684 TaxID=716928 RepID=A0A249PKY2_9HYPH|nr:curlin [Sinorhizobium sojae]ASY66588.1 hypothetical protein SJ05684_b56060 [Sinorhizobium sojae CCBAU 05684]